MLLCIWYLDVILLHNQSYLIFIVCLHTLLYTLIICQSKFVVLKLACKFFLILKQFLDHSWVLVEHYGKFLLVFGECLLQFLLQNQLHLLYGNLQHLIFLYKLAIFSKRHDLSFHFADWVIDQLLQLILFVANHLCDFAIAYFGSKTLLWYFSIISDHFL